MELSKEGQVPDAEDFLEAVVAPGRGWIPNLFKALAYNRELTKAWAAMGNAVRDDALNPRSRELVILLVSHLLRSEYEWVHHLEASSKVGIDAAEVAELLAWPARGTWNSTDWAVLNAAAATATHDQMPEWCVAVLRDALGEKGFVDICVTTAYYVAVAHLISALGVRLESGGSEASAHLMSAPPSTGSATPVM